MHSGLHLFISAILAFALSLVPFGSVLAQVSAPDSRESVDITEAKVSGRVVEKSRNKRPISVCRISIYAGTNRPEVSTLTKEDGSFHLQLPFGEYRILFECTGYKSTVFPLYIREDTVNLGDIRLEIGEEIAAASVEAEGLLRRNGTRITYDVLKDPDASKINMTEMISKIPEIRMSSSNGNLMLGNLPMDRILVNNAEHGMINAKRQYPMEFIKAEHMRRIELVLPGDPEYQNEKPILLITLAKELPFGFASNLQAKSDTKNNHSPSADAVINTPLIGIGLKYDYSYSGEPALVDNSIRETTGEASLPGTVKTSQTAWSKSMSHSAGTNLFRSFAGNRIRFNASVTGKWAESSRYSETSSTIIAPNGECTDEKWETKGQSKSPFSFGAAAKLSGTFRDKDDRRKSSKNRWTLSYSFKEESNESLDNYQTYDYWSSTQTGEHRLNAQIAFSRFVDLPEYKSSIITDGGYYDRRHISETDSEKMDYRQGVAFLNIKNLGSFLNETIGYTAYLNMEYLNDRGEYLRETVETPLDYSTFNINPYLGISCKLKGFVSSAGYTRKVTRPTMKQLNPYEDKSNPEMVRKGNPELKGQKTDIISLSLMHRPKNRKVPVFSILYNYSTTKDKITPIILCPDDGIAINTFVNIGENSSHTIHGIMEWQFTKTAYINTGIKYQWSRSILPGGLQNIFSSPSLDAAISWNPKWFDLNAEISLRPSLVSVQTLRTDMEAMANISISRYFKKPHIGISLGVSDIFHNGGFRKSEIVGSNFVQTNMQERLGRTFSARVYWRFGKFRQTETVSVNAYDL